MKKIGFKKLLLACMAAAIVSSSSVPVMAATETNTSLIQTENQMMSRYTKEEQAVIDGFISMQDKITNVLKTEHGEYSYNYNQVKSIIDKYDFTEVNKVLGSDYTHESFLKEAISAIDTSVPESPIRARKNICGLNKLTSGWNYNKVFADKDETDYNITKFKDYQIIIGAGGTIGAGITSVVPPLAILLGSFSSLGIGYYQSLINHTDRMNRKSNCGTVTTINKFVLTWTVKSQKGYNY